VDYGGPLKLAPLLAATTLFAQDASETLAKARDKTLAESSRLAKLVCVETIDRSYFSNGDAALPQSCERVALDRKKGRYKPKLESTDRVRVEVRFSQDREIYSWTGRAPRSQPVDDILELGPVGTGAFAAHLLDIFSNPAVRFRLLDEKPDTLQVGFRVPVDASHFQVAAGAEWVPAGYTGSFDIDRVSLAVRRFVIETGELPPETSLCEASATHLFENRETADAWRLPSESRSRQILRDATETDSAIKFSDCREQAASPQPAIQGDPLPPGLAVSLAFTAPIDPETAAAGDSIAATVTEPVMEGSKVWAPVGAVVTGRILRMEHQLAAMEKNVRLPKAFLLIIAFDTLEVNGASSPFYAILVRPAPSRVQSGNPRLDAWPHGTFVFPARDSRYVVRVPFESHWRTVAAPALR
jgi:hypothetical protein